jgi:DNA-binding HxlR family transcriptional regulator
MDAMQLPANSRCPVARSLEVVGKKWNLLIVRELFYGNRRFSQLRSRIGLPSDVLASRLDALVSQGVLDRRSYQEPGARARDEYALTEAGRDLVGVLAALTEWGEEHLFKGSPPPVMYLDQSTGGEVRLAFVDERGDEVPWSRVVLARTRVRTAGDGEGS